MATPNKLARTVIRCQYCTAWYKSTLINKHESICAKNPNAPKHFRSLGKTYITKTLLPLPKGQTPLSLSQVLFMWDSPPEQVMREDAFHLLEQGVLIRTRHSNYFVVPANISSDNLDLLWHHINKAKRMGAR